MLGADSVCGADAGLSVEPETVLTILNRGPVPRRDVVKLRPVY